MTDWQLENVPCDYCGESDANVMIAGRDRLHGTTGQFNVVACRKCGLARTDPRPILADLGKAYPDEYAPHREETIRGEPPTGLLRWALVNFRGYPLGDRSPLRWLGWPMACRALNKRRAIQYLPYAGEGKLLDFGCGAGGYVARMAAAGWQAEGLDFSENAVAAGRAAGLTMHRGTLPGVDLPAASYDALTMWQVIEHVPSPMETLKAAFELLKPGGQLLVVCPRIDALGVNRFGPAWYALDLPRHLTHFSADTLTRHLETAGFADIRHRAVRRPGALRRSYGYLAEDTGGAYHRRMSRSRALVGAQTFLAWMLRRTTQIFCTARKP